MIINRLRDMRRSALVVATVALALVMAGCGDSASSDEGSSAKAPSGVPAEVTDRLAQFQEEPTGITQTQEVAEPLPEKTVGFVICNDPSCAQFAGYWETMADALGWNLQTVNVQGANVNEAVSQLVQSGVDYIGMTGASISQYRAAMADAKEAGIPIFECFGTDEVQGEANNLYSNCFDNPTYVLQGQLLADYMIADSDGAANVLGVNLPAYEVLTTMSDSIGEELSAQCESCSYETVNPTPEDLGAGKVSNQVISYLQSNPDVNYVVSTYAPLVQGLPEALAAAGLDDKVKIVGSQPVQTQIQGIADGSLGSWLNLPREFSLWVMADQMVQHAAGQWSAENAKEQALAPMYFLTEENAEEALEFTDGWPGPDGFQDDYLDMWGVS